MTPAPAPVPERPSEPDDGREGTPGDIPADVPTGPTDAELADAVLAVSRRLRRAWLAALEPTGITPHHARALRAVARRGPVRLGALAEELHVAARSVTDVVDALEAQGLLRREPDPADRRATVVVVTDRGRDLAAVAERARTDRAGEVFAGLTPGQRAHLAALLCAALADAPS